MFLIKYLEGNDMIQTGIVFI